MAGFGTKTFITDDDWMTPKEAWENITKYIPKDKIIWEPFFGDGKSAEYLREIGCQEVIHDKDDFFESDKGEVIITNCPFSIKKQIFNKLYELNKPFILIVPQFTLSTGYIRENFSSSNDIQIIIPRGRIQFIHKDKGKMGKCNFDCFYICYKMNLPQDIIWLYIDKDTKKIKPKKD
jgi:hypothetical protein